MEYWTLDLGMGLSVYHVKLKTQLITTAGISAGEGPWDFPFQLNRQ